MAAESNSERYNILVCGSIGDGKSALIKSFLPEGYTGPMPENAVAAGGVTKECRSYPIRGFDNCYFVDTPGVGDHDAKLSDVIPMIEEYFKAGPLGNGVHGVVITCAVGQGRLTLGSKIAGEVLKLSVFKYDGDARDRVIICGTKRDKEDPEDQEEWRNQVAPFFAPVIGGEPGHICLTGCKFTAKGRGKNNIGELEKALQQVRTVDEAMAFTKADSTELLTVLK